MILFGHNIFVPVIYFTALQSILFVKDGYCITIILPYETKEKSCALNKSLESDFHFNAEKIINDCSKKYDD